MHQGLHHLANFQNVCGLLIISDEPTLVGFFTCSLCAKKDTYKEKPGRRPGTPVEDRPPQTSGQGSTSPLSVAGKYMQTKPKDSP